MIPILLCSYGVATGPIAFLAQKDLQSGNEYAMISTIFAQVAYLLVILAALVVGVSLTNVFVLFGIIMLVGLVIQLRIAFQEDTKFPPLETPIMGEEDGSETTPELVEEEDTPPEVLERKRRRFLKWTIICFALALLTRTADLLSLNLEAFVSNSLINPWACRHTI